MWVTCHLDMSFKIVDIQPMKFFPSDSEEAGSVLVWVLKVVLWVNMGFVFLWLLFPTGWLLSPWTGFFFSPFLFFKDPHFLLKPQREKKPVMWECTPRKIKCWAWLLYLEWEAGGTTKRSRKFKQRGDGKEIQSVIKMKRDEQETGTSKKMKWDTERQRDREGGTETAPRAAFKTKVRAERQTVSSLKGQAHGVQRAFLYDISEARGMKRLISIYTLALINTPMRTETCLFTPLHTQRAIHSACAQRTEGRRISGNYALQALRVC